eukprot:4202043-Alexandrium_andersonii.AAC.1
MQAQTRAGAQAQAQPQANTYRNSPKLQAKAVDHSYSLVAYLSIAVLRQAFADLCLPACVQVRARTHTCTVGTDSH